MLQPNQEQTKNCPTKRRLFKGNFIFAAREDHIEIIEQGWLASEDGRVVSCGKERPAGWEHTAFEDFGDALVIPPFADIHLHAVQYVNRALGLDKKLLEWLKAYTYPEEKRFADLDYARRVFMDLRHELWAWGSLYSVIFSSLHLEASELLMELLDEAGLCAFVGKVNMNRNSAAGLDETAEESLAASEELVRRSQRFSERVRPIITPRFAPSCTEELLRGLGDLREKYDLPVQSHLNETPEEVLWVKELFPKSRSYLQVYEDYGLLPEGKTVMAHCIYNTPEEERLLASKRVFMAHCPSSNMNLASGVMPVRKYLNPSYKMGLGSDISGGEMLSMQGVMRDALKSSLLLSRFRKDETLALNWRELLWLATRGGARFFGERGSLLPGMHCDFLCVDDSRNLRYRPLTLEERVQKFLLLGSSDMIKGRYLDAELIPEPQVEEV